MTMFKRDFNKRSDGAHHMTQAHIRDRFDTEFRRRKDKTFVEPLFQKVAYYFVSERVPAFQRTRTALDENASNRHALNMVTEGFIQGIILGKFGWSYRKTADCFEQLMFREGEDWRVLETTNAHTQIKKESDTIRFTEIIKKLFG